MGAVCPGTEEYFSTNIVQNGWHMAIMKSRINFESVLLLFLNSLHTMQFLVAFIIQHLTVKKKVNKQNFSVNSRKKGNRIQSSVIDSAYFTYPDGQKCKESFLIMERILWRATCHSVGLLPGEISLVLCPLGPLVLSSEIASLSTVFMTTRDEQQRMSSWAVHIFSSLMHSESIPNPIIRQDT